MLAFLSHLIGGAVGSTSILSLAIMLSAFMFEDATTIIVGVLSADGVIGFPIALLSLYSGIILGDAVLYGIGVLARTHPRLAHYIDHEFTAPFRTWLERRYPLTILSGHFVPGLRFTTYIASGFFRSPLGTFLLLAVIGGLLWATVLFLVSFWFGSLTAGWIGNLRWGVVIIFILSLLFISRHNLLAYRSRKEAGIVGDTHTP